MIQKHKSKFSLHGVRWKLATVTTIGRKDFMRKTRDKTRAKEGYSEELPQRQADTQLYTTMKTEDLLPHALELYTKGHLRQAQLLFQELVTKDAMCAEAYHHLGIIHFHDGHIDQALEQLKRAVAVQPENPQILFNYGALLQESHEYSEALRMYSRVLNCIAEHVPTLLKCAAVMGIIGNSSIAEQICKHVLAKEPNNSQAYSLLGNCLKDQGRIDESLSAFQQACFLDPHDATTLSNYLLTLNYSSKKAEEIYTEHVAGLRRCVTASSVGNCGGVSTQPLLQRQRSRQPLRIGYVSGDFRTHSVAYFFEPLLQFHQGQKVSIYCYSNSAISDDTTERLKRYRSTWRLIYNRDDAEVGRMMARDKIDICVDLSGHTADNRVSLFQHRCAPLQVSYLGYPNTTGVEAMDYRFTDALADPADAPSRCTEKLYRLPSGFLCYRPPDNAPAIDSAREPIGASVVFGSCNALPKINESVVSLWAQLLRSIPDSVIALKAKSFIDKEVLLRYQRLFEYHGVAKERLRFQSYAFSIPDHLQWYNQVDFALDTFPYNGTTTTCEALLMGVPVITLVGQCHAGRVGYSLLTQVGLTETICYSAQEYVKAGQQLAQDRQQYRSFRHGLRRQLLNSSLCNGKKFYAELEEAFVTIANQ
ncbi:MAG: tetratricopeptide repeat protein [Chitinivibrionales bacterium]|nr:tetratricopeptide repeat protein [Chitinivibrionales bacterium]